MSEKNHLEDKIYAQQFSAEKAILPGADLPWLAELRESAISKYVEIGLPGPKVEEWKYTNLTSLNLETFNAALQTQHRSGHSVDAMALAGISGSKVVFVDGYFDEGRSDIKNQPGVRLVSLNEFIKSDSQAAKALLEKRDDQNSLFHLNTAMMTGGYVLMIDENVKLAEPIQIFHMASAASDGKSLRTKCFIQAQRNSSAQIIEIFNGNNDQRYWRQNLCEVKVDDHASIEVYQFQLESNEAIHMGETRIDVSGEGEFKHYSLNIGGKISRTEIKPTLNGLHGNVELNGAFLGRNGSSHDVFTHMKHMVPEGTSNQVYRGVLDKGGKSAFQGKVYVAKDAQLTNADQSNKNLLLDRNAEANSKPELLIYADDVKCSHGATVGELDAEALFYLKSRGLDQKAAKSLLVEAFVAEVFEDIALESLRAKYLELARAWLDEDE